MADIHRSLARVDYHCRMCNTEFDDRDELENHDCPEADDAGVDDEDDERGPAPLVTDGTGAYLDLEGPHKCDLCQTVHDSLDELATHPCTPSPPVPSGARNVALNGPGPVTRGGGR
ncbi:hypothetical protein U3A55_12060 [Salarchaeum sp. III]|uniref:hypothetical protein n=1 Tax=Salarchaeum sp. III TaxID=3107927 RepID=UPI002EDB19BA